MKLRNKKTGEIVEKYPDRFVINSGEQIRQYDSLAELNDEWEDAPEEPKEHWTIGHDGAIFKLSEWENQKDHEEIGNYFDSEEEAEQVVEKLKAWKRLKDKGFKFNGYGFHTTSGRLLIGAKGARNVERKDLDLLFGGEE